MKNLKKLSIYKFLTNKIKNSNLFWESRALFSSIEIFFSFLNYGFKQSKKVYQRRKLEPSPYTKSQKTIPSEKTYLKGYNSMINFKRAHYLEKAMYCETPKNNNLDFTHRQLTNYLISEDGKNDVCFRYLEKLRKEYEDYPNNFKCFMLKTKKNRWDADEKKILEKVIKKRRSIRSFGFEKISEKKFEKVLTAGSFAPSSCNAQPIHFITITEKDLVKNILSAASGVREFAEDVPNVILVLSDTRHYKPYIQHIMIYQDIAAAIQNCLLMAEVQDLSACWCSLASDSQEFDQDHIYALFKIPTYMVIGGIIAIGETSTNVCPVPRRPLNSIWHKEKYNSKET
tara:strand:+ start:726 stop:1751 length:1026 start_codon:yes stop_codon:yes gene_type:complete